MTEINSTVKYALNAEWFDPESTITKPFFLFYFPFDNTIELYDVKNNRLFLKRTRVEGLRATDIYVGNTVTIFSRQIKLTNYANIFTQRIMCVAMQKTFALIKPEAIKHKGSILRMIYENKFKINKLRMINVSKELASDLYGDRKGHTDFPNIISEIMSGQCIAMELVGPNGLQKLIDLAGPQDPEKAKVDAPGSIRACFGKGPINNAIHTSKTLEDAEKEIDLFFKKHASDPALSPVLLKDTTCCIVKPHAVRDDHLGDIVFMIEKEGFTITAMEMFYVEVINAEEFYEVYKGVVQEFTDMVSELTSGACVVLEIQGPMGPETPQEFRKLAGPSDPGVARQLRPNTIRSMYGVSQVQNAVHVTDLPEDALLEVEYFFKILQ